LRPSLRFIFLPAIQPTHASALAADQPAVQIKQEDADALLVLPIGQSMHSVDPELGLYWPASHPTHKPFTPVHPAAHTQSAKLTLSAADTVLAGHILQRDTLSVE